MFLTWSGSFADGGSDEIVSASRPLASSQACDNVAATTLPKLLSCSAARSQWDEPSRRRAGSCCDILQTTAPFHFQFASPACAEYSRALSSGCPAAAAPGRAVVGHLHLTPARPVLRQSEVVRKVGGVGHGERVGRKQLRGGDRARARHVAAHHAARRRAAARGREGAVQALVVQRAPAPEAVRVPVDTSPTVVKFPALAVLLMVRVLPAIPVAGDGAGGRERCAGDCARGVHARREHVRAVHVVAQQLVAAHVDLYSLQIRATAFEGESVSVTCWPTRWPSQARPRWTGSPRRACPPPCSRLPARPCRGRCR